jgi:hypothetical protein
MLGALLQTYRATSSTARTSFVLVFIDHPDFLRILFSFKSIFAIIEEEDEIVE